MNRRHDFSEHDPVSEAMNLLRDASGGPPLNPEMENRLMQEFDARNVSARTRRVKPLIIAVALLVASGATFAASGGIERIRQWFVTIEINGQQTQVALDENGSHDMTVETADGGTAQVHIEKRGDGEGRKRTTINVTKDSGNERQVMKSVMVSGRPDLSAPTEYTMDDLGDAQPVKEWTDEAGDVRQIYVLPKEEGGSNVFLVTLPPDQEDASAPASTGGRTAVSIHETGTAAGADVNHNELDVVNEAPEAAPAAGPVVRLLASTAKDFAGDGITTEVIPGEGGMLTIKAVRGEDDECVMKIRIATRKNVTEEPGDGPIDIQSPDGQIRIKVKAAGGGE